MKAAAQEGVQLLLSMSIGGVRDDGEILAPAADAAPFRACGICARVCSLRTATWRERRGGDGHGALDGTLVGAASRGHRRDVDAADCHQFALRPDSGVACHQPVFFGNRRAALRRRPPVPDMAYDGA